MQVEMRQKNDKKNMNNISDWRSNGNPRSCDVIAVLVNMTSFLFIFYCWESIFNRFLTAIGLPIEMKQCT